MIMIGLVMAEASRGARHLRDALHTSQILDDLLTHRPDIGPKAGESGGKGPLERHGQGVEPHGDGGEQAHRQKALQDIQGGIFEIGPAGGIIDSTLKNTDHQAHAEQSPAQL